MIDLSNKSKEYLLGIDSRAINRSLNPDEIEHIFNVLGYTSWKGIGAYKYPIISRIFAYHIFVKWKLVPGPQPDRAISLSPYVDMIVKFLAEFFEIKKGLTLFNIAKACILPGEKILFVDYQESDAVFLGKAIIQESFPEAIVIPKVATIHGCYDVAVDTE